MPDLLLLYSCLVAIVVFCALCQHHFSMSYSAMPSERIFRNIPLHRPCFCPPFLAHCYSFRSVNRNVPGTTNNRKLGVFSKTDFSSKPRFLGGVPSAFYPIFAVFVLFLHGRSVFPRLFTLFFAPFNRIFRVFGTHFSPKFAHF